MRQHQFDQLLAWNMVTAQYLALLVEQNQVGRPLTEEEYRECGQRAHGAAEAVKGFFQENRKR